MAENKSKTKKTGAKVKGSAQNKKNKKILLIYAGHKTILPRFPMSILVLATYLRDRGYEPDVLDTRIDDYEKIDFSQYLYVGISSMSGPQLSSAIPIAKFIKKRFPDTFLVWGGPHVSLFSSQSIKSNLVDLVVVSEGEEQSFEIAEQRSKGKKDFDKIKGLYIIKDGKAIFTGQRSFLDMEKLNLPAYDLVDYKKYQDSVEYFGYESSRGCPHRCKFCYVIDFHKRKWRKKSVSKTLDELQKIVDTYHPKKIEFIEDNFYVDLNRVKQIAQGMIDRKFNIEWTSFCRADYLNSKLADDEFFKIVKKSGCDALSIGVESGSPTMLKKIDKDITIEQVMNACKTLQKYKIMPFLSFIIGIPSESKKELYETLAFYDELMKKIGKLEINGLFIYAPYPGTPIFDLAVQKGYKPLGSIEEWANWNYNDIKNVKWYPKSYRKKLEIISIIARYRYFIHRLGFYSKGYKAQKLGNVRNRLLFRVAVPILNFSAMVRWKFHLFSFALEWKLFDYYREKMFRIK